VCVLSAFGNFDSEEAPAQYGLSRANWRGGGCRKLILYKENW